MKKTILISVLATLCFFLKAAAQGNKTSSGASVTGRVTDEQGLPLPGATVQVLSAKAISITGKDGEFRIPMAGTSGILSVSFIGYIALKYPFKLSDGPY
ncbi:carboxypeptidase regulatory-like domain-containing protein [Mucilaginibacter sp. UC70_90]